MLKTFAIAVALLLLGAALLLWRLGEGDTERSGIAAPAMAAAPEASPTAEQGARREEVTPAVPPTGSAEVEKRTKREVLRDYWGDRWPAVEQQIVAQGGDLDALVEGDITPWEVVEADLRKLVLSDAASLRKSLAAALQLEPEKDAYDLMLRQNGRRPTKEILANLQAVTESYRAELDLKAEELALQEERYRQRVWDEGLYRAGPFFETGGPDYLREPGGGWSISSNVREWAIYFRLEPDRDPAYANAMGEVKRVRSERQEGWQEVLDSLR